MDGLEFSLSFFWDTIKPWNWWSNKWQHFCLTNPYLNFLIQMIKLPKDHGISIIGLCLCLVPIFPLHLSSWKKPPIGIWQLVLMSKERTEYRKWYIVKLSPSSFQKESVTICFVGAICPLLPIYMALWDCVRKTLLLLAVVILGRRSAHFIKGSKSLAINQTCLGVFLGGRGRWSCLEQRLSDLPKALKPVRLRSWELNPGDLTPSIPRSFPEHISSPVWKM